MTGKQSIVEFFLENNIEVVFHLPGIHSLPLTALLAQSQDTITTVIPRHESDLAFMADGYARVSGKPGVLVITPGPGLGNILTGCMEAFNSDVPLLIIHVDVERSHVAEGILHGLADPEGMFRSITKKTFRVSALNEIADLLRQAYHHCMSGRKGPVLISVPYVFFEKNIPDQPVSHLQRFITDGENPQYLSEFLTALKALLTNKQKPMILAGKGAMENRAADILNRICRDKSIPLLTTTGGKGVLSDSHHYVFGNVMSRTAKEIIASADIVIAVGTRLRDTEVRRRSVKIGELVHIDVDAHWIDKNYGSTLNYTGDITRVLADIEKMFSMMTFSWDMRALARVRQKETEALKNSPAFQIMRMLRNVIPEETTVVCDLNMISYWCEYYFPVYLQNSFIMPRGISPIFYALPAGIGAKIGKPANPCLVICGDGGILPTISELSIMERYKVPVVIFLYNNNSYGILEDIVSERYKIKGGMGLKNPSFTDLARSFGIKAERTDTLQGLRNIFDSGISWNEPFLIEFTGPVYEPPWKQETP